MTKKEKDKSAMEMSVMLVQESWKLFKKIWVTRNETLHSTDSYAALKADSEMTKQLIQYKTNQDEMLQYCDRHHIDYWILEIVKWNRKQKRNLLRILDKLHKLYLIEIKLAAEGQKKLTDYMD